MAKTFVGVELLQVFVLLSLEVETGVRWDAKPVIWSRVCSIHWYSLVLALRVSDKMLKQCVKCG